MLEMSFVMNNKANFKCDHCGKYLGTEEDIPREWEFCPHCGEKLYK